MFVKIIKSRKLREEIEIQTILYFTTLMTTAEE